MNYRKTIGSQIFRIIISILFLFIFPTNFLANAAEDGTLKWAFATNGTVNSPAIGLDGTIYAGSNDYHLYAINPDGTIKWEFEASGAVKPSPAIGLDGTIYVGSGNYLYAINADGTQKWASHAFGSVSSPAIGLDGTIYVGSNDHNLYAINSSSLGLSNSAWPMYMHDVRHTGRAAAVQIPAPLANFDADALTGRAPLTVNFTDKSTGDINDWLWDFGDGESSTDQNPTYIYTEEGLYTVKLTVTGPGGTDTETKADYIQVGDSTRCSKDKEPMQGKGGSERREWENGG